MSFDDDPTLKEFGRKKQHLDRMLADLSDDLQSTNNSIIAENETLWEIGRFSENYDPDKYEALLVRTRRDALEAKLNTKYILDRLTLQENDHKMDQLAFMTHLLRELRYGLFAIFFLLAFICWKLS